MAVVDWSDDLTVHNREMDGQHKWLFTLARALWREAEGDGESTDIAIAALVDYIHVHFAAEEALLASMAYPDLARHKGEHGAIFKAVDDIIDRLADSDRRILMRELAEFVSEWLVRHIRSEDARYGLLLGGRSPPPPPAAAPTAADRLRQLKALCDEGLISPDDFDRQKQSILDSI